MVAEMSDKVCRCERRDSITYHCKGQTGCKYCVLKVSRFGRREYCESLMFRSGECINHAATAEADRRAATASAAGGPEWKEAVACLSKN